MASSSSGLGAGTKREIIHIILDSSDDEGGPAPAASANSSKSNNPKKRVKSEPGGRAHAPANTPAGPGVVSVVVGIDDDDDDDDLGDDDNFEMVTGVAGKGKGKKLGSDVMVVSSSEACTSSTEFAKGEGAQKIDDDLEITQHKGTNLKKLSHARPNCIGIEWAKLTDAEKKNDYCDNCKCLVCDVLVKDCKHWDQHFKAEPTKFWMTKRQAMRAAKKTSINIGCKHRHDNNHRCTDACDKTSKEAAPAPALPTSYSYSTTPHPYANTSHYGATKPTPVVPPPLQQPTPMVPGPTVAVPVVADSLKILTLELRASVTVPPKRVQQKHQKTVLSSSYPYQSIQDDYRYNRAASAYDSCKTPADVVTVLGTHPQLSALLTAAAGCDLVYTDDKKMRNGSNLYSMPDNIPILQLVRASDSKKLPLLGSGRMSGRHAKSTTSYGSSFRSDRLAYEAMIRKAKDAEATAVRTSPSGKQKGVTAATKINTDWEAIRLARILMYANASNKIQCITKIVPCADSSATGDGNDSTEADTDDKGAADSAGAANSAAAGTGAVATGNYRVTVDIFAMPTAFEGPSAYTQQLGHEPHLLMMQDIFGLDANKDANTTFAQARSDWKQFKAKYIGKPIKQANDIMRMGINTGRDKVGMPPGLVNCKPMTFQLQSMSWMLEAEQEGIEAKMWTTARIGAKTFYYSLPLGRVSAERPEPVRGGLLAEAMGLGKTVICLGLILLNPAPGYHHGFACDASGMDPIVGKRYSRKDDDFDLCEDEFIKLPPSERARFVVVDKPGATAVPYSMPAGTAASATSAALAAAAAGPASSSSSSSATAAGTMVVESGPGPSTAGTAVPMVAGALPAMAQQPAASSSAAATLSSSSPVVPVASGSLAAPGLLAAASKQVSGSMQIRLPPSSSAMAMRLPAPSLSASAAASSRATAVAMAPSVDGAQPATSAATSASAASAPSFIASSTFTGSKAGYVYRSGQQGLGYYAEGKVGAHAAALSSGGSDKEQPLIKSGGTLVICAVSLVSQWAAEARHKVSGTVNITAYHGGNRKRDPSFLARQDVVITTYGTLTSDRGYWANKASSAADYVPPLEAVEWHRVILDESHMIKAGNTNAAKACKAIKSARRWCVTGTPISSDVSDLSSQLEFVGLNQVAAATRWPSFGKRSVRRGRGRFNSYLHYGTSVRDTADCHKYFTTLFAVENGGIMCRHVHGQQVNGKPILELPPKTEAVEAIILGAKERADYSKALEHAQQQYKSIAKANRGRSTLRILSMLLPLRQMCSGGRQDKPKVVSLDEGSECPICFEVATDPVKSSKCGHIYCRDCITSLLAQGTGTEPCPDEDCDHDITIKHIKDAPAVAASAGSILVNKFQNVLFETKVNTLLKQLEKLTKEDATSKVLVFSQFQSTLTRIQDMLPKVGLQFRTLTGGMTRSQRTKALDQFQNDPPTTIFLLSTRAAACGINLTQANHVYLMEPCFNVAVEEQAIGRVYRMGQKRKVRVVRFVAKDTVEESMMEHRAEAAKRATAAEAATGDNSSGGATKPSAESAAAGSAMSSAAMAMAAAAANDEEDDFDAAGSIMADNVKTATYDFNKLFKVVDAPSETEEDSDDSDDGGARGTNGSHKHPGAKGKRKRSSTGAKKKKKKVSSKKKTASKKPASSNTGWGWGWF